MNVISMYTHSLGSVQWQNEASHKLMRNNDLLLQREMRQIEKEKGKRLSCIRSFSHTHSEKKHKHTHSKYETSFWCWPRSKSHHLSAKLLLLHSPFDFSFALLRNLKFSIFCIRGIEHTFNRSTCECELKCADAQKTDYAKNCRISLQYEKIH